MFRRLIGESKSSIGGAHGMNRRRFLGLFALPFAPLATKSIALAPKKPFLVSGMEPLPISDYVICGDGRLILFGPSDTTWTWDGQWGRA